MKLRIRGDSIRLRLKRGEVNQLVAGTGIVEQTHFPGTVFTFCLDTTDDHNISATFNDSRLRVSLPKLRLADWASTDAVSMHAEQQLPGTGSLSVLIEKDFSCLEPGHFRNCEDDADTFPHPHARSRSTHPA